jgi:N-acyl amino acid synthase of PEP-CTERM/exosortase system
MDRRNLHMDALQISRQIFTSFIAETEAQRTFAYQIRFKVYSGEAGYFDPRNYADGLEVDAYDARSLQSLVMVKPSGSLVGASRLILPSQDQATLYQLPFDTVVDASDQDQEKLRQAEATGEASRLCITRELVPHLRKLMEQGTIPEMDLVRVGACAKLWAMQGIVAMSARARITHWCAVMEPRLLRSLAQLGIRFTPVGPPVRYYGERQPCYGQIEEILGRVKREFPEAHRILTDDGRYYS